jgi:hypothetical protein
LTASHTYILEKAFISFIVVISFVILWVTFLELAYQEGSIYSPSSCLASSLIKEDKVSSYRGSVQSIYYNT